MKKVIMAKLGANAKGFFANNDINRVANIDARIMVLNATLLFIPASLITNGARRKIYEMDIKLVIPPRISVLNDVFFDLFNP